jgi:hypothetical protein
MAINRADHFLVLRSCSIKATISAPSWVGRRSGEEL